MSHFTYIGGQLHAEQVALKDIAAQFGTPAYIYSRAAIEQNWSALDNAFGSHPHLICYAVKANGNLAILNLLARAGSGFDIVSAGELRRVIMAGGDPSKVVFSGVAKTEDELAFVLNNNIRSINVESLAELTRVQQVAERLNVQAPISIRVNPDVDAQTHPYIATGMEEAKFGIAMDDAYDAYQQAAAMSHISIHGIACHIGSQITQTAPFTDAIRIVLQMVKRLADSGITIKQLDLGGGLGIQYKDEVPPSAETYVTAMLDCLREFDVDLPIAIEPGRSIVGNAGILLTKVEYLKHNANKSFAIVDAGMNDLLRPSLYSAYHEILPTQQSSAEPKTYDVVGPVCETGDVLGYDRSLAVNDDDLLAVTCAGAYGWVMSSNYNVRARPPELIVDGEDVHIARARETFEDMIRGEALLP